MNRNGPGNRWAKSYSGEQESKPLKFSVLYIAKDMAGGLTRKILRPGYGLEPKYYDVLIGKKVNRTVKKGTPLSWDLI